MLNAQTVPGIAIPGRAPATARTDTWPCFRAREHLRCFRVSLRVSSVVSCIVPGCLKAMWVFGLEWMTQGLIS